MHLSPFFEAVAVVVVSSEAKSEFPDEGDAPVVPSTKKRGRPASCKLPPETSEETTCLEKEVSDSDGCSEAYISSEDAADFSEEEPQPKKVPKKLANKKSSKKKIFPLVIDLGPGSDSGNSDISGPEDVSGAEEVPEGDEEVDASPYHFVKDHPCPGPLPGHSRTSEGTPLVREGSTAVMCFNKLFPLSVWDHIVEQTNIYAGDYWELQNKELKRVRTHTHTSTHI